MATQERFTTTYPDAVSAASEQELALTPAQVNAVNLLHYDYTLGMFEKQANQYARWKKSQGCPEKFDDLEQRATTALEDLHFARNNPTEVQRLRRDWGQEAGIFEGYLNNLSPKISSSRENLEQAATKFGPLDLIKVAFVFAKKATNPKTSEEQKARLFNIAGYSQKEAADIAKKVAISAGLTTAAVIASYPGVIVGVSEGATNSFFKSIAENNALMAIGLSYLIHYGSMSINAAQNIKLLNHKAIRNSPNVFATSMYYLLEKLIPRHEKIKNVSSLLAAMMPVVLQEPFIWGAATIFIPGMELPAIVARNVAMSGSNVLEAVLNQAWLMIGQRRHQKSQDSL